MLGAGSVGQGGKQQGLVPELVANSPLQFSQQRSVQRFGGIRIVR